MTRPSRRIAWLKAAFKEFEKFPPRVKDDFRFALTVAAEGSKSDRAKPMRALGSGVFEIALAYRGNAFRLVYAVQLGDALWVIQAFQKKSTRGIKTPKHVIELIENRIKRLKQMLEESES
jgi:phage-related protein